MPQFELNGRPVDLAVGPDMPLLWALRDVAGLRESWRKAQAAHADLGAPTQTTDETTVPDTGTDEHFGSEAVEACRWAESCRPDAAEKGRTQTEGDSEAHNSRQV